MNEQAPMEALERASERGRSTGARGRAGFRWDHLPKGEPKNSLPGQCSPGGNPWDANTLMG